MALPCQLLSARNSLNRQWCRLQGAAPWGLTVRGLDGCVGSPIAVLKIGQGQTPTLALATDTHQGGSRNGPACHIAPTVPVSMTPSGWKACALDPSLAPRGLCALGG